MIRVFSALIAASLVGTALGQTAAPASDAVRWAFQNLYLDQSIRVRVTGSETLGSTTTTTTGELYWWLTNADRATPTAKIEFTEYRNGIITQRAVGNGRQFYNFTPQKNEFWVTSYGTYGTQQPQRYLPNLADDFTSAMKGSMTYLARLIREAYVVNGYRAWVPGGSEALITQIAPATSDPVLPSRTYAATDTTQYAMFWIGNPARKSVVFELTQDAGGAWDITRIFFAERSSLGGKARLVEWTAEIFRDFIPAADDFVFIPPSTARPVVGPRPNIG